MSTSCLAALRHQFMQSNQPNMQNAVFAFGMACQKRIRLSRTAEIETPIDGSHSLSTMNGASSGLCSTLRSETRAQLQVYAVAAEKVTSQTAEIPKVKSSRAKLGEMSPETAKDIYRDMFLCREFEEMCAQIYYRGKMFGFVHLYSGQEAVSTGVIRNLRKDDYICSTYRDHVHALSKNVPAKNIMAELFGKKTGICRGQGGSMHMFSAEHGLVSATNIAISCLLSCTVYLQLTCHYHDCFKLSSFTSK